MSKKSSINKVFPGVIFFVKDHCFNKSWLYIRNSTAKVIQKKSSGLLYRIIGCDNLTQCESVDT